MKIIAFSLWGNDLKYTLGAVRNADIAQELFPDWICRFYVGKSVPQSILGQLEKKTNVNIVRMDEDGDWSGMFWRFHPCSEEGVDAVLSRDTDSRLTQREKDAVDEWMNSDKGFHIMRDHPWHAAPILGGMWGCKKGTLTEMSSLIDSIQKGDFWQVDQIFLRDYIYPLIKDDSFVHDEFFEKKPFPTERNNLEFVGEVYDENNNINEEHREVLRSALV
jgi:hypothetical protein|tara:strand:- start:2029 stop:2685 length:657 start_codon:yes stop_codon:yes gene_type:complete